MNVKQITKIGSSTTFKVSGDLTIKGITKPIDFTATIVAKGTIITATAELQIHRFMWNIDLQPEPAKSWNFLAAIKNKAMPDEISITLNLVFNKPNL